MTEAELKKILQKGEDSQQQFNSANLFHADAVPVAGMGVEMLDRDYFNQFVLKQYGDLPEDLEPVIE